MTDDLAELFGRLATETEKSGLIRYPDFSSEDAGAEGPGRNTVSVIRELLQRTSADPSACLLAAAGAGLFPTRQPPDDLPDSTARNLYVLQSLERRDYCVRTARPEDLPALSVLERQCWAPGLRTAEIVLERRLAGHPRGQLVLSVGDAVVGAIYSQRIRHPDVLEGATAATVDSLHDGSANVAQLLAVNILPEMQQRNLGDQLLEFMLVYLSQQEWVASVVAVTLCKSFDAAGGDTLEAYIRQRNEHGVLADPILRFHELHGALIERVMPGYRPDDLKNGGCGVLVRYDIHRRRRSDLQAQTDSAGAATARETSLPEIRADLQDVVIACLGEERRSAFSFDRPLMEMGLDSADLLRLNEEIVQRYGVAPGPAFFFRYNTAGKIAAYLSERLAPEEVRQERGDADEGIAKLPVLRGPDERWRERDVAIVGMACRLPGGIDTPEALWECLQSGRSVVGELPPGRWHWPDGIDPAGRHRGIDRGGFLSDVAAFDAPFFRVSPAEADSMDPQQRMLLELSWLAIEHAGYAADSLAGSRTGVFVGASGSDYARLMDLSRRPAEAHYGTGSSMAVLANRLSYFYDLHGPSLLLDTACSSSLVAVHEAVRSIASGESSQALVGGINLILHPANSIAYYKAGMLSKDGLCKTFDRDANGYVRSEGAVMLLLKPLKQALADRDNVHAVIRGTACNHGGLAGGLTVPNPERQGRLLQSAWQDAEIDPSALGYIEAHGTGTPLGDPVEVQGIAQAFAEAVGKRSDRPEDRCGLGSVKTNLGHLEAAAGIVGLLKSVLCLQYRQLPPSLHFRQLNEHIDLSGSGLHVVDRLQPWQPPADGGPRVAGVSSFGSGGTNAHVVVAEYPRAPEACRPETGGPVLFVLSAASVRQLQAYARKYADWLGTAAGSSVPLARLAFQLQTGRRAMKERLALAVADRQELIRRLEAFCAEPARQTFYGEADPERFGALTRGRAGEAFLRSLAADGDLERIASLWLSGAEIDWSLLGGLGTGDPGMQRIAVPTYPFARHTYWLPEGEMPAAVDTGNETHAETARDPAGDVEPILLAPVWRPVTAAAGAGNEAFPAPDDNLLVVGGGARHLEAIRSVYPGAQSMDIDPDLTAGTLAERLGACGTLDHIVWIAPERNAASSGCENLIGEQRPGLLYLFRLVKALLAQSYGEGTLGWTVVTWGTQAVFGSELPDPAHAGVHGFAGVLGSEFPRWRIRALDLEGGEDWPVREAMGLPADGDVWSRRGGQWFRRSLCPVNALPDSPPPYRENGVYVVIGGAGGIGEAWTRHVVERYRAQVIWIGRRQPDAEIKVKLESVGQLGPAPVYIVADASDPASLDAAVATIGQRWPAVHGVIHAAVGPFDRSIAETDERRFRDVLSAKIDATVHVARAFRTEPLDFLLYFSSVVALEKNGGLSGYAAGGAFQDAFALHLDERRGGPVRVVNWGHWDVGTATAVADATKTRLQRSGFAPIRPSEGMAALQALLSAPVRQMVLLKTSRPDLVPLVDMGRTLLIHEDAAAPRIREPAPDPDASDASVDALKPLSLFGNAALDAHLLPLFAATLRSLGLAEGDPAEMPGGVAGFYRDWLRAGRRMLADRGADPGAAADPERAWREWEDARRGSLAHADLAAAVDLAEACLRALPDILSGRLRATDVIFPGASMRRVEDIYRGNAVADHFNAILAGSLASAVESRVRGDPEARLRILEIGAGTGGTTAAVLPRLEPYRRNIAEYAYTDVSKVFLFHAEEQFAGDHPYVRPALFDVEKPLVGQDVETGGYDFAIATNVLHATRDIRTTLSNCKAALRKGGLLLLNEISGPSLFAHLTFGLLEGWWLTEDKPLRIPDAPGLYPDGWRKVLAEEGFPDVRFPAPGSHVLGQQVIVAESDGVAWQTAAAVPSARQAAVSGQSPARAEPAESPDLPEAPDGAARTDDEALKAAANSLLRKLVARTLRMDTNEIDVREPLEAYGIDSILVVQITDALREIFPDVATTLLFECQTIDALADHFVRNGRERLTEIAGAPVPAVPATAASQAPAGPVPVSSGKPVAKPHGQGRPSAARPSEAADGIAVIGMSCRFPQADGLDAYWEVLKSGRNCIREVPEERWPLRDFFHADADEAVEQGKSYGKWGGFLDRVTEFDPLFFNIAPREAVAIDPQERLFLQTAWETLEDAGYTRERLATEFRQQLGVFVGITRTGFDLFGPQLWERGETIYPHTSFSSVANRLSYFLNARGPSVPVDTMCSSSLTAIHQACQSLRSGECELAIAGGVNVYLHPSGYVGLSASRMLSPDGVCRSFGRGGNGFVPGEGVAAVLLKPLSRAIADKDRIQAVIRATHVNHGGKTNGYTVPNPQAQAELVRDALRKAGIDARAVSYIEAHGTGTELGDPIEVAGLTKAFRHFTQDSGFCALGSAKSNMGHLEAAAGIAGFMKVVLQMRHRQLAPSLHAADPNPNIGFAATPFVVQQTLTDWPRPVLEDGTECPRIAGISSFGAGGANAHVVVEEYSDPDRLPLETPYGCAVVLSARTEERLRAGAGRLLDFVRGRIAAGAPPALPDLAYTLQVGREQMDQRLALVAASLDEMQEKLAAYLGGAEGMDGLYAGNARQHRDVIGAFADDEDMQDTAAAWFRSGRYPKLLGLWSKGLNVDWERMYRGLYPAGREPRRIGLPTYPFAAAPYWLPVGETRSGIRPRNEDAALSAPRTEDAAPPPSIAPAAGPVAVPKPAAVTLRNPASVRTEFQALASVKQHVLRSLHDERPQGTAAPEAAGDAGLGVRDLGDGVYAIGPEGPVGRNGGTVAVERAAAALTACVGWLDELARDGEGIGDGVPPKVLLLGGLDRMFPGDDIPRSVSPFADAVAALAGCLLPVVAVLTGENRRNAMRMAAACDIAVCSAEGSYDVPDPSDPSPRPVRGDALRQYGATMPVVPAAEAESYALDVARNIARSSSTALRELRQHLQQSGADAPARNENAGAEAPDAGAGWPAPPLPREAGAPERVELSSDVVLLKRYPDGVAVVTLCDRASRNTFSPEFVSGVIEAFAHIGSRPEYKAVVLTGYDSYFACGGTKEGLLAIQSGRARFTDEQSYSLPLACEIPVIAAMQGHAIGAGWAMGLYCDWTLYSEESVYRSPYMLYGFTPGAGSTLIFPHRLGQGLAREILMTAREFPGRELKERGTGMPVLPRNEVLGHALALAHRLASSDRAELVRRKAERCGHLRERLPAVFAQELAMHERTFVGNEEVVANISRYFNEVAGQDVSTRLPGHAGSGGNAAADRPTLAGVLDTLRRSLAEELHMQPAEIDDEAVFIDIGMDSISAVTWVRKVGGQFGLPLPATRVYSCPTLTRFAEFVLSELGQRGPATDRPVAPAKGDADSLLAGLRESLAEELAIAPDALDADIKFVDLGLDSVTAVTWIRAINRRYGLSVAATSVYSHPTLAAFHRYLSTLQKDSGGFEALDPAKEETPLPPAAPERAVNSEIQPARVRVFPLGEQAQPEQTAAEARSIPAIAVIGMAGQFPKAGSVGQFWRNLVEGRDCVSEIPPSRWRIDDYYDPDRNVPGKTVCSRMGLLDDVDMFDPLFFSISPSEAEYMDPQQRLFLQNSWRCIEDAGYDPADLSGSQCGVFVGCAAGDYSQLMAGRSQSAQGLIGESVSILPARIAYFLDLQGPCLAIDTACSASLVALASACDSLVLGNCELALAGGVYVITGPDIHVKMSKAGMLSPDGRCFSFDRRANGFVPGEGVGVLLLKRLDDAERDGDDIYGVIRGWGVNQDGRTNGITAPNQQSQTRLETAVYEKFGIDPAHIQLVEAHGTGTPLGDPIEVEALHESFRRYTDRKNYCALGSVKSNIGHLATAAGVTGVIKSLLALRHRQLPPTINHETLNEHIDLGESPFYVNTRCQPWHAEAGRKRLVAVSSFGFSGTNAHMVLEEFADPDRPSAGADGAPVSVLLPLSARSNEQLRRYARSVAEFLAEGDDDRETNLTDIAHTFQVGRTAMAHRLAIVAGTVGELRAGLSGYASTGLPGARCFLGGAGASPGEMPAGSETASEDALVAVAERWVAGEAIDWASLPRPGEVRRRHGLPTYPFAEERYWTPEAEPGTEADAETESEADIVEDSAEVSDGGRPQLSSVDRSLWQGVALAEGIDWQGRLRHWLDRKVLVVHADDAVGDAFRRLLAQMAEVSGLGEPANIAYCPPGDVMAALSAQAPECLLFLGSAAGTLRQDHREEMAKLLDGAGERATAVVFAQAGAAEAEGLGGLFAGTRRGGHGCLLVSQSDRTDGTVAMQRVVREWLAFGSGTDSSGLSEIHYAGEERLRRSERIRYQPDAVCLIRKEWRQKQPAPQDPPRSRGTVLILVNDDSRKIARDLFGPGDFRRTVVIGDAGDVGGQADRIGDFFGFGDATATMSDAQALIGRYDDITHIVDLVDLHETAVDEDADRPGRIVLYQALAAAGDDISILHITRELQSFRADRMSLAGARFAGLVKMLGADYRHVDARTVDIDGAAQEDPAQLGRILLREFGSLLQETEICYREEERFAPALSVAEAEPETGERDPALQIADDAVYVVSGGTNGVGLEIARHLAGKGCTKLVLMGITPLPPKGEWAVAADQADLPPYVRAKLRDLIELDRQVDHLEIYTGSLTDRHSLRRYFMKIRATLGPIRGVIHAAAVYSDAETPGFATKTPERMRQVMEPKADGLESLHAVFKADPLDFFVSFSSMTALVPHLARGASDYAMASSFVGYFNGFRHRQDGGSRYRTVIWSDWNETGAIVRVGEEKAAAVAATFDRLGMRTFSSREGCALFDLAMACGTGSMVVIGHVNRHRFERVAPQLLYARPDFGEREHLVAAGSNPEAEAVAAPPVLSCIEQWEAEKFSGLDVPVRRITDAIGLDEIRKLPPSLVHRIHRLMFGAAAGKAVPGDHAELIHSTVMEVLKLKAMDPAQSFQSYGLDSISAMVLATRLEKKLGREIRPQWLIEFPTVDMLSHHLTVQDSKSLLA